METFDSDYVFKIVAIGNGGTGKTSLFRRFALNKFETSYLMTLGVDFTTKEIEIEDPRKENEHDKVKVKLILADTAGQEFFFKIRPAYYMGAQSGIIVFDLTNKNSYESLSKWINEIQTYVPNIIITIVGNKLDLEDQRRISFEEALQFSESRNIKYFETSAKSGEGVNELFTYLARQILNTIPMKTESQ